MTRTTLKALACALALALLGTDALAAQALAQAIDNDGLTLRQRLNVVRGEERRTPEERELQRENAEQATRRRLILQQRNRAIGSQRSEPILPRTGRSSVVVTQ